MIHLIVGDEAAKNLVAAFEIDENLRGEVLVLKDTLGIGNIVSLPGVSHDDIRTEFWQTIVPNFGQKVEDEEKLKHTIEVALQMEEPFCLWLAPCVSDVCVYYWLLTHFKSMPGILHTINIIGLPFLNAKGQLFYPNNFSEIPPKEFIKTKRLLKEVTIAEFELEGDEWFRLQRDNTWLRTYEGGKKIVSRDVSYFDNIIKANITDEMQKASKVAHEALKKITQTVSNLFIEYRIRQLLHQELFSFNGNIDGPLKDIEIKKIGSAIETSEETE